MPINNRFRGAIEEILSIENTLMRNVRELLNEYHQYEPFMSKEQFSSFENFLQLYYAPLLERTYGNLHFNVETEEELLTFLTHLKNNMLLTLTYRLKYIVHIGIKCNSFVENVTSLNKTYPALPCIDQKLTNGFTRYQVCSLAIEEATKSAPSEAAEQILMDFARKAKILAKSANTAIGLCHSGSATKDNIDGVVVQLLGKNKLDEAARIAVANAISLIQMLNPLQTIMIKDWISENLLHYNEAATLSHYLYAFLNRLIAYQGHDKEEDDSQACSMDETKWNILTNIMSSLRESGQISNDIIAHQLIIIGYKLATTENTRSGYELAKLLMHFYFPSDENSLSQYHQVGKSLRAFANLISLPRLKRELEAQKNKRSILADEAEALKRSDYMPNWLPENHYFHTRNAVADDNIRHERILAYKGKLLKLTN